MNLDEKIVGRLEELIQVAHNLRWENKDPNAHSVNRKGFVQLLSSSENILGSVFGKDSPFYSNLNSSHHLTPRTHHVDRISGALSAALEDYQNGYIFETRQLIEAEIFVDLIEQAEILLENGYKGPAAVVVGSVLEDGLRKLCERQEITLSEKPKLDGMNSELRKAGVFNKLTQKKITALADIRNNAAHGHWDQFTDQDVVEMIRDVGRILEEHH